MDPEIEVNTPERDYESEARAQGWKPQEEYQGENWVDAKTFVERGDKYVGILKDRFDKVERRLKYQEELNESLKRQYHRLEAQRKREVDDLVKQLEKERRNAITNGDGEAFDKAEKALNEVKEVQLEMEKTSTVKTQEDPPPWAIAWMQENEWYGKDKALTAVAEAYAVELRQAQPFLGEREFMDRVAEYVKTEMPHKFQNKNKKQVADVEIDDRRPAQTSGGKKSYNTLPPEAKKEFNRFVREGIFKDTDADRKQYADLYYEGE